MRNVPQTESAALPAVKRFFEASLYLLLITSVLALVSTGRLDFFSTIVAPIAIVARAIRHWRGRGPELSPRAARWLVMLYIPILPADLLFLSRSLASGAPNELMYAALLATTHLLLFITVVRLYSARTTRDYLFLAMLAFAMMLVTAILTVNTMYLVFLVLFLVLAVATFVSLEIRRGAEGAATVALEAGTPAGKRMQRALGVTSGAVAVSALVVGAAVFLLIPRFTAGYLYSLNLQPTLMSGFSDNVELGRIGEIKKSGEVVMRVRFEEEDGVGAGVKWRGIALTTFDGRRWYQEPKAGVAVTADTMGWHQFGEWAPRQTTEEMIKLAKQYRTLPQHKRRVVQYTVLLEPIATETVFVATQGFALRGNFAPGVQVAGRASRGGYLEVDQTGSVSNPYRNLNRIRYEGKSRLPTFPAAALRASPAEYHEDLKQIYLQLPQLDPKIKELALEVTAAAPTPYDKANAIEHYLRTQFGYTLELSGTPGLDPLPHFLFVSRAGHCEYFAAAMTVMLRTLGIPARYVNGFLPGEYNDVAGDYIIRSRDAHSWVEVLFPGYGWVAFDPTPPSDPPARGWLDRAGLYWDWFELTWSEWVVNYDVNHQALLARNVGRGSKEFAQETREYLKNWYEKGVAWAKRGQEEIAAAPWKGLIGLAALVIAGLWWKRIGIWELWMRLGVAVGRNTGRGESGRKRVATIHYEEMLKALARRGWKKRAGQTASEFVEAIRPGELQEIVSEMTMMYEAARFGERVEGMKKFGELQRAIRAFLKSGARAAAA